MPSYLTPTSKQTIALTKPVEPAYTPKGKAQVLRAGNHVSVVEGPLAQRIAASLDELYAKETDSTTGIVLETQALDAQLDTGIWMAMHQQSLHTGTSEHTGALYGVKQSDVGIQDVVSFSDTLKEMSPEQKGNSALLLIPDNEAVGGLTTTLLSRTHCSPYTNTLVKAARSQGVRVFTSMEAYTKYVQCRASN